MNIQSAPQTNPSFGHLYTPNAIKLAGGKKIKKKEILKMPLIKDNMDRFDIIFESKPDDLSHLKRIASFIGNVFAGTSVGTLLALLADDIRGFIAGATAGILSGSMIAIFDKPIGSQGYDFHGEKTYADGTKIGTEPFSFNANFPDQKIIEQTVNELSKADKAIFLSIIAKNYPKNGEFDAKSILNILNNKVIKNDFANGDAFNYSIDASGNNSLLTKFFELPSSEGNTKEYRKIASIIKSTPNIDFNQKDKLGISIIENILNMENPSALDVVKDIEFEHSKDLDELFNKIQNQDFKEKAKNLKIKFEDSFEVLKNTRDVKAFENAITPQLESPFCDSQELAIDVLTKASLLPSKNDQMLQAVNKILYKYLPENLRMDVL